MKYTHKILNTKNERFSNFKITATALLQKKVI